MLASDVNGIGEDAIEGLGNHGKIGGALKDLKGGGVHAEAILEEEIDTHPWKTPEPLHPET